MYQYGTCSTPKVQHKTKGLAGERTSSRRESSGIPLHSSRETREICTCVISALRATQHDPSPFMSALGGLRTTRKRRRVPPVDLRAVFFVRAIVSCVSGKPLCVVFVNSRLALGQKSPTVSPSLKLISPHFGFASLAILSCSRVGQMSAELWANADDERSTE